MKGEAKRPRRMMEKIAQPGAMDAVPLPLLATRSVATAAAKIFPVLLVLNMVFSSFWFGVVFGAGCR